MLVVTNPSGPPHSILTVSGIFTDGPVFNSTVQVRVTVEPTVMIPAAAGLLVILTLGAGTKNAERKGL